MRILQAVFLVGGAFLSGCALESSQLVPAHWAVSEEEGRFYLNNQEDDIQYEVISVGGMPDFIKERKIPGGLRLLQYSAGTAGTSTLVRIERALVIDSKSGNLIGDYPFRYTSLPNRNGTHNINQPQWCFEKRHLLIVDTEANHDERIQLPQENMSPHCLDTQQAGEQKSDETSKNQRHPDVTHLGANLDGSVHRQYFTEPSTPQYPSEASTLVARLTSIIRQRDAEKLQTLLDSEVVFSFAESGSDRRFLEYWSLQEHPEKSAVWEHLESLLKIPPAYLESEQELVFPYFIAEWPEYMDASEFQVVVNSEAEQHAEPSNLAPLLGTLSVGSSIKIIKPPLSQPASEWLYVETHEGVFGYLLKNHARSALDFRLGLAKKAQGWKIAYLVAGD